MPSKLPKPTDETKDLFASVVPDHPGVAIRPMFGQLAAFVHGNMFMGIFGEDVFVRLPEADRDELRRAGGAAFEPMAGRPMKEYVVLPESWRDDLDRIRGWAARSLDHVEELPPKAKAKTKASSKERTRTRRTIRSDA